MLFNEGGAIMKALNKIKSVVTTKDFGKTVGIGILTVGFNVGMAIAQDKLSDSAKALTKKK